MFSSATLSDNRFTIKVLTLLCVHVLSVFIPQSQLRFHFSMQLLKPRLRLNLEHSFDRLSDIHHNVGKICCLFPTLPLCNTFPDSIAPFWCFMHNVNVKKKQYILAHLKHCFFFKTLEKNVWNYPFRCCLFLNRSKYELLAVLIQRQLGLNNPVFYEHLHCKNY